MQTTRHISIEVTVMADEGITDEQVYKLLDLKLSKINTAKVWVVSTMEISR